MAQFFEPFLQGTQTVQNGKTDPIDQPGYYRSPALCGEQVAFVSEDDLWLTPIAGGVARRMTSGRGRVDHPAFSPEGKWLAYVSNEEGAFEVFVMPAAGGEARRLTYLGGETAVIGWAGDKQIIFSSNHLQPFARITEIYLVHLETLVITHVPCGPANHISVDARGRMVLGRYGGDPAYWKRYKGGRTGQIWIDQKGDGRFAKLIRTGGNTASPSWIGDKVYFISDHEGMGNIYSVKEDGSALTQHTFSQDFYVRGLTVDHGRIAYHSGGDLFYFEAATETSEQTSPLKIEIEYRSPHSQVSRKFVSAGPYLEDYEMHPNAQKAIVSARGRSFSFDLWKGPIFQSGQDGAMRYRLGRFMRDGVRVALISDAGGEEAIEIHDTVNRTIIERLEGLELGRTLDLKLSPVGDQAAVINHRNELIWVDLKTRRSRLVDHSKWSRIYGFNWSHDGRFIAYSRSLNERQSAIFICEVEPAAKAFQTHQVTEPILRDVSPVFDPAGEYLYFISYREFDPVYDNLHFDLSFPRGSKPYLITLRHSLVSPFSADHRQRKEPEKKKTDNEDPGRPNQDGQAGELLNRDRVEIDFDGIKERIIAFPLPDGRYGQIAATRDKLFFTRLPIDGSLKRERFSGAPWARAHLEVYSFKDDKSENLVNGITSFRLSQDGKHILYRSGNELRWIKAGERPKESDFPSAGWLNLDRIQIYLQPRTEWRQMYREAWRLQRDHFWNENMSNVDWNRVFNRYLPLLDRVGSRAEISDLLWEMQGELGTSHAYESGGDYRPNPSYGIGLLGAELGYDESAGGYRIHKIMKGDIWDENASSPLARPGVGLKKDDVLLAIDGQPLTQNQPPAQHLLDRAGREISVTFRRASGEIETRTVRALQSEQKLCYREWVKHNREFVRAVSGGRLGYLHIPNMGPHGYAEFHRAFLTELDYDGLIIDVRFNGGGHVSQLLLEKLARRRIGYSKSRWFGVQPYPEESPVGNMVALTNEYAGSDGDIFSHSFKLLKLGPLIGKRTWGGVIGINPSHSLADGGYTTQPEYSFWFEDVGWKVENYGTEPDIEVEISPHAHAAGEDPQLARAIEVCLEQLRGTPPQRPRLGAGPDLSLPIL
jgi:tricorn protease